MLQWIGKDTINYCFRSFFIHLLQANGKRTINISFWNARNPTRMKFLDSPYICTGILWGCISWPSPFQSSCKLEKKKGIVINIATDGFKHNTTNQGIFSNPENGPCSKGTSFWISSKGIDNISLWNGNEVEFSGTKFCSVKTSDSEPALQQSFIDERTGSFCLFVCFLWRAAIYGRRREGGGGGRAPATKPAIAPSQRCSS